jgi:hypothetical protein
MRHRFEHIQAFFDTTRGQETVADLLRRLNVALGKAAAEDIVMDEVLPEIKRRR